VRAAVGDVVEEVVGGEPLADEPSEDVGEDDDDRVDPAGLDLCAEGFQVQSSLRKVELTTGARRRRHFQPPGFAPKRQGAKNERAKVKDNPGPVVVSLI
jgi:hypothetical protein